MEEAVTILLEQESATAVTAIEEAFVKSVGKNTRRQYDHIFLHVSMFMKRTPWQFCSSVYG